MIDLAPNLTFLFIEHVTWLFFGYQGQVTEGISKGWKVSPMKLYFPFFKSSENMKLSRFLEWATNILILFK